MKEEHKTKLIESVKVALEKDDYYMIGRLGRLFVSMQETQAKLDTILGANDDSDVELF